MKFSYTIGIERTGIPEKPLDTYRPAYRVKRDAVEAKISEALNRHGVRYEDAGRDLHCYEVASKILHTEAEAKRFFTGVEKAFKACGVKPHHPDTVCGGGHIHVGMKPSRFRIEVVRDVCERFYLPWVFSQPDEEGACDNLTAYFNYDSAAVQAGMKGHPAPYECEWRFDYTAARLLFPSKVTRAIVNSELDRKDFSIRTTDFNTIEFRFFEAPLDWSEQRDHLEFLFAYLAYMRRRYKAGHRVRVQPRTLADLQEIQLDECITAFKKLCGSLRLKYSRYEKYVKRNLLPRWELDRVRR